MFARSLPGSGNKPSRRSRRFAPKRRAGAGSERTAGLYHGHVDFSLVAAAAGLEFDLRQESAARTAFRRLQDLAAWALKEDDSAAGGIGSLLEFSVRTAKGRFRERVNMHEAPLEIQRVLARIAVRALQREWENGGGFEEAAAIVCRSSRAISMCGVCPPQQLLPPHSPEERHVVDGGDDAGTPGRGARTFSVRFAGCDENIYFKDDCVRHCTLDSVEHERSALFDFASVVVEDPRLGLFEGGDLPESSQLLMWTHNGF